VRKERIFCAQLAQVEGLSAKQPVLMVFEDVHWSDPTTREFLDRLIERVRQLSVLVVITFRPEFVAPWIGLLHVTQISLGRLSLRESGEMVRHVAGAEDLPQEIVDKIIERTDGIPLFIEELTKSVLERGLQRRVGSGRDTAVIAIPTTLQGSLLARLDRLAPTREVAQIGSAIGRRFSHELISAVADLPPREIDEALAQLVRAELIFASGAPYIEYTFKHALVQEAAYGTMLRSSRQRIHARIAEVLESRFPDIVTAQPQLLALHCTEAGLGEKAISYHVRAGQLSVARSAMTEAADQLRKGLDLLGSLPPSEQRARQEIELQMALARALMATKGYSAPAVSEALARARGIAEQLKRPDCLLPLLYLQYAYHTVRGEHGLGLTLAKQLEEFGTDGNDDTARLLGRLLRGASCFYLGGFVRARQLFEQCDDLKAPERRAVFAALTAEDPYATRLAWLASTLAFLGHMDQARLRMDEALFEARRLGHVYTLVWVLGMICWIDKAAGCPGQVEGHAKELVSLAGQHGFPLWLARGLLWQGWSSTAMGRPQEGVASLEQGLSLLRKTGASIAAPLALVWLAEAHGKLGRPQDGLDCLSEATRLVESSSERYCEVDLYRVQGELLIARGDAAAAEAVLHRALAIARHQGARTFELRAAVELARLWLGQGKSAQAGELLAPIQVWFAEGHDRPALQEARQLMAELA
jgi:predicted ATPase